MRLLQAILATLLFAASLHAADGVAVLDSLAYAQATKGGESLAMGQAFEPTGLELNTDANGFAAIVFSNGVSLYLSPRTRLVVDEFQQTPFDSRPDDFDFEPSRSVLKISLIEGLIAVSQRDPNPISELTINLKDGISTSINARAAVVISQSVEQEVAILDGRGSVSIHGENQLLNQSYRLQAHVLEPGNRIRPITDALIQEWQPLSDHANTARRRWYFQTKDGAIRPIRLLPTSVQSSKPFNSTKL